MALWKSVDYLVSSEGGKHRLPADVVEELEEAIKSASLVKSDFDSCGNKGVQVIVRGKYGEEVFDGTVTDFIREKVRLHHESWVLSPLRRILLWSLSKDDGTQKEYSLKGRLESDWPNPETIDDLRKELVRLQDVEREYKKLKDTISAISKVLDD